MILADIESALREIDERVYYGMVDESEKETVWKCTVFNRVSSRFNGNRTSVSDYFDVHVIRENYVPEGLDAEIIDKLCRLEGVRLASADCTYTYVPKPNTNIVVEILSIHFVRARKANGVD